LATDSAARVDRPVEAASLSDAALEEINHLWTTVRAFSTTAHDVNNAMQVIAGNAELLEARDLDPVVRRRLEVIRTEAARASTTINRLLHYAREPGGQVQRMDLWPFAESAVAMRASSAGRRRVVLAIERGGSGPMNAMLESAKTQQTLLNLLLAAEDFVAGRRQATITVTIERQAELTVVNLLASGEAVGAATEASVDPPSLNSALQLWMAAHLAAAQQGRLDVVDSASGRTYRFALPAANP
jgi:signal transduction histidine kinase